MFFAIFSKYNDNNVVDKFYGEEIQISNIYNQDAFGYVVTTEAELSGNPTEYRVEDGKVKRRPMSEIIAEIEGKNPLLKELNKLKQENTLLGQQAVDLDLRLLMGGM